MLAPGAEAPEEALEIPEPDLSMELQEQLKMYLHEQHVELAEELQKPGPSSGEVFSDEKRQERTDRATEKHAEAALHVMIVTLKSFDPELSAAKLSEDLRRILHTELVVAHLEPSFTAALRALVPRDRAEWLSPSVERHLRRRRAYSALSESRICRRMGSLRVCFVMFLEHPRTHETLSSAFRGGAMVGVAGGALGLMVGSSAGAMAGILTAPLTAGLSIPCGMALGGGLGTGAGAMAGAGAGFLGAGAIAGVLSSYEFKLSAAALDAWRCATHQAGRARDGMTETKARANEGATGALCCLGDEFSRFRAGASRMRSSVGDTAADTLARLRTAVGDRKTQATAAAAASGAVCLGTCAGTAGVVAGGAAGIACGAVPALLTFGLSLPVGAAVGSLSGLLAGATAGGAAGLVGGGVAGRRLYDEWSSGRFGGVCQRALGPLPSESVPKPSAQMSPRR